MAIPERKPRVSGRVTPKGGPQKPIPAKAAPARRARREPRPPKPVLIGKRPSSPGFLAVVAVMWMGVGVVLLVTLKVSWSLVPSIVAFGIGILFLRGAISTLLRRDRSSDS